MKKYILGLVLVALSGAAVAGQDAPSKEWCVTAADKVFMFYALAGHCGMTKEGAKGAFIAASTTNYRNATKKCGEQKVLNDDQLVAVAQLSIGRSYVFVNQYGQLAACQYVEQATFK